MRHCSKRYKKRLTDDFEAYRGWINTDYWRKKCKTTDYHTLVRTRYGRLSIFIHKMRTNRPLNTTKELTPESKYYDRQSGFYFNELPGGYTEDSNGNFIFTIKDGNCIYFKYDIVELNQNNHIQTK